MLSSSPPKIHEPLAVGVSPRPTGRQNCETRGLNSATTGPTAVVNSRNGGTRSMAARSGPAHMWLRRVETMRHFWSLSGYRRS
jgi:hypothetical protein